MHPITPLKSRVPHGALVMLERSAGKLARSVLRGLGGSDPTWLPAVTERPWLPVGRLFSEESCFRVND
jgi:hypothetical protein